MKQALSKKNKVSSFFSNHLSVVIIKLSETNHPKPGKPYVEVNFARNQSLCRTPLLASHSAPIDLLILGYALLWV
jgi:hypothetical protein